ncbi:MAG: hypothetical protein L6V35_00165 [Alistipes putredinis]|nr:MAG: hypothetical protein L6V35_00165 [Alistipes putredinis]
MKQVLAEAVENLHRKGALPCQVRIQAGLLPHYGKGRGVKFSGRLRTKTRAARKRIQL